MNHAIEIKNLTVDLGGFKLLDINLNIPKGTITGFIGKNGAGKTTLIKTLSDVYRASSGEILYDGKPMFGNEVEVKSKLGIVYDSLIFPLTLSPIKIVTMVSPFYRNFDMTLWQELMTRFDLPKDKKLNTYSKGMCVKFSIALALSHHPELLILDEPTAGLDPEARADILDLLLEFMQNENNTIFFSTHITSDLDKIADYISFIDNGKILLSEEKDALLDHYVLVQLEKESMTAEIRANLSGLKETTFGFQGLCSDKNLLANIPDIRISRPSIEDILIYRGGLDA